MKIFYKTLLLLFFNSVLIISHSFAQQAPGIEWQNTIGGNSWDALWSISQTFDGGFILGGFSESDSSGDKTENSKGFEDYWIVKTDALGNIQWQNTVGGSNVDDVTAIKQSLDGGYVIGGSSKSNISGDKSENCLGDYDYWVVKLNSSGNIQWQNTIGGNQRDLLTCLSPTTDAGYILGGYSYSGISGDKNADNYDSTLVTADYWIIKLDSIGNILWQKTIGGNDLEEFYSIQQTTDGGYILGGQSASNISGDKTEDEVGGGDYWLVKIDASGNIEWQNTIGGGDFDVLTSVHQTSDFGYILGGSSTSNISGDKNENSMGVWDYWIVKTDSIGNIQWQNTIGGSSWDQLYSIQQTSDSGYILGGISKSNISGDKSQNCLGGSDYWIVKTNVSGVLQWQKTIGGNDWEYLYSLQQTADGGYILGGFSPSNISGDKTENPIGLDDYWIVKLLPDTITGISPTPALPSGEGAAIAPNPSHGIFQITLPPSSNQKTNYTLEVINTLGQRVFKDGFSSVSKSPSGGFRGPLDLSFLPKGMYVLKINNGNVTTSNKKLIIE